MVILTDGKKLFPFLLSWSKMMLSWGKVHWVFFSNEEQMSWGRVEIFCPSGLFELTRRPSGQKISTLPLDLSAKKICSRPSGPKWSLGTTKPNLRDKTILVPTRGTPNLLGFLEIMKKLNCQRQTKSAKKISRGRKKPGSDAKSVQNFSPAIFLYSSAR